MQVKLKDDRIAHLERQLQISTQKLKVTNPITVKANSVTGGRNTSRNRLPSPSVRSSNGAGSHKRFDPTEYVRNRQERQKRLGLMTKVT